MIEIGVTARRHDDVVIRAGGGDPTRGTAPRHHDGVRSETAVEDFIPANEASAVRREKRVHLFDEPALELVLGAVRVPSVGRIVWSDAELAKLCLCARAGFPLRLRGLVAANV